MTLRERVVEVLERWCGDDVIEMPPISHSAGDSGQPDARSRIYRNKPAGIGLQVERPASAESVGGLAVGVWIGWIFSAWVSARLARIAALELVAPVQRALLKLAQEWNPTVSVAALVFQRGWALMVRDPDTPARQTALAKLEKLAIEGDTSETAAAAIVEILNEYAASRTNRLRMSAKGVLESESGIEEVVPISEETLERTFVGLNGLGWLF
jgi:hypothetical protein